MAIFEVIPKNFDCSPESSDARTFIVRGSLDQVKSRVSDLGAIVREVSIARTSTVDYFLPEDNVSLRKAVQQFT